MHRRTTQQAHAPNGYTISLAPADQLCVWQLCLGNRLTAAATGSRLLCLRSMLVGTAMNLLCLGNRLLCWTSLKKRHLQTTGFAHTLASSARCVRKSKMAASIKPQKAPILRNDCNQKFLGMPAQTPTCVTVQQRYTPSIEGLPTSLFREHVRRNLALCQHDRSLFRDQTYTRTVGSNLTSLRTMYTRLKRNGSAAVPLPAKITDNQYQGPFHWVDSFP